LIASGFADHPAAWEISGSADSKDFGMISHKLKTTEIGADDKTNPVN
jgi:hypothetical protein